MTSCTDFYQNLTGLSVLVVERHSAEQHQCSTGVQNAAHGTFKLILTRAENVVLWQQEPKKPPGSQSNKRTGEQESYECTIQCEVKNILHAFCFSCVHFCVLLRFSFLLESTKCWSECAHQPVLQFIRVTAMMAVHVGHDLNLQHVCFNVTHSSEDLTHKHGHTCQNNEHYHVKQRKRDKVTASVFVGSWSESKFSR